MVRWKGSIQEEIIAQFEDWDSDGGVHHQTACSRVDKIGKYFGSRIAKNRGIPNEISE